MLQTNAYRLLDNEEEIYYCLLLLTTTHLQHAPICTSVLEESSNSAEGYHSGQWILAFVNCCMRIYAAYT